MTAYKGFKFRLYPTKEQAEQINKTLGCCRYVYNHMLERRIKAYKRRKESFSYIGMQNLLVRRLNTPAAAWMMPTKAFSKTVMDSRSSRANTITTRATRQPMQKASMFPTRLSSCLVWAGCRTVRAVISKVRFAMLRFAVLPAESILCLSSARWRLNQSPVSIQ